MAELWIPRLNEQPDVNNVFDMMMVFQEELDRITNPDDIQAWHPVAIGALRALTVAIKSMSFEDRQISVATNLALIKNVDDSSRQWEVENVGLRGSLYDVDCIKRGAGIAPEISLALDVESYYAITDPDDGELMLTTAAAPIGQVQYIRPDMAA